MNNQEAKERFQEVRTKMLTNWKVLEDKEITKDSTPSEIFQYATSLDDEKWIQIDLIDLLVFWSGQCVIPAEIVGFDRMGACNDNCNEFFS